MMSWNSKVYFTWFEDLKALFTLEP